MHSTSIIKIGLKWPVCRPIRCTWMVWGHLLLHIILSFPIQAIMMRWNKPSKNGRTGNAWFSRPICCYVRPPRVRVFCGMWSPLSFTTWQFLCSGGAEEAVFSEAPQLCGLTRGPQPDHKRKNTAGTHSHTERSERDDYYFQNEVTLL